jgi:hypothetical protein
MINLSRIAGTFVVTVLINTIVFGQITQPITASRLDAPMFTVDPAPDPALGHNRLLREKTGGEGFFRQIGPYKVKGSPYLFGGKIKGDMFSIEAKAYNIYLSYDTYDQNVGFFSTSNPDQALVKEPGDIDSFILHANPELLIHTPAKFIYGPHLGSKEKVYFQEIYAGPKYSVYKKYKSDLGIVSDNYIQSELRQFDLLVEYVYTDSEKKMKKIKPNAFAVTKEFKKVKDLSGLITDEIFAANTEEAFRKTFEYLNN